MASKASTLLLAQFDLRFSERENAGFVFGLDEVGRGCLAGPVVAACVAFSSNSIGYLSQPPSGVRVADSKTLSEAVRFKTEQWLMAAPGLHSAIGLSDVEEIDRLNILWASMAAMEKAFFDVARRVAHPAGQGSQLQHRVCVDGNRLPKKFQNLPKNFAVEAVIKGDAKVFAIAAASIVAKNFRDNLMAELHKQFPDYGWASNVGYPTPDHKNAIQNCGITPHHRTSFRL